MKKLYVGNMPFQASEQELQEWFAEAGFTADDVVIVRDRYSNLSRGFGFVEIRNDEDAERAIQTMNGKDFQGRNLVINEARPRREGGGGRGRGRGGSRRREW
ncbi:MAG: RNA recognition motif domain-containing protein [Terriglobia bacterium]